MARRFAAMLLGVTTLFLTAATQQCPTRPSCPMMQKGGMECCRTQSGLTTPRCCGGAIGRAAAPAAITSVRTVVQLAAVPAAAVVGDIGLAAPVAGLCSSSGLPISPPGRTLVAQHTSLIL
jgi:hypothetical protein